MGAWLNSLAGETRQVLVVTHSTQILDRAAEGSIRMVQSALDQVGTKSIHRRYEPARPESIQVRRGHAAVGDPVGERAEVPQFVIRRWITEDLSDLATLMGVRPSDALLASQFLVVEGASDESVLRQWARALALPSGPETGWIPADSYSKAELVAKTLSISQPGSAVDVILDAGPDSERRLSNCAEVRVKGSCAGPVDASDQEYFPRLFCADGSSFTVCHRKS